MGGAFVGIDKVITTRLNTGSSIGFGADVKDKDTPSFNTREEITAGDMIKYGIIPEFMGRFPIIVGLDSLSKDELVRVLTEPKNNIVSQFKRLFALDNVKLDITDGALSEIAKIAASDETGARGLRSVIEKSLLKLQFKLPKLAREGLTSVVINDEFITEHTDPLMVFDEDLGNANINE